MNQSFVPKALNPPINNDDRELGLLVYHLFVAEADKIGELPADKVVDAGPLAAPPAKPGAKAPATGPAKGAAAKPAVSPAPAKPAPKPTK